MSSRVPGVREETHTSDDYPSDCHGRDHHDKKTFEFFRHVFSREPDAYGEQASYKNDAGHLPGEEIDVRRPRPWIEGIANVGPDEHPKSGTKNDFVDV